VKGAGVSALLYIDWSRGGGIARMQQSKAIRKREKNSAGIQIRDFPVRETSECYCSRALCYIASMNVNLTVHIDLLC
jgi:hypothetical protein